MFSKLASQLGVNRTVMALSLARLGDAIGNSILVVVIPLYIARLPAPTFNVPESVRVGILIALFGLVNAILQPFMGALSDRLGKRKIMIQAGLVIVMLATVAFSLAGRFIDLLLLRAAQGVGVALTIPASLAIMAAATEHRTRGGSMGVYSTSRMVGFAVGPLLGGFLLERFGFNTSFFVGAGFILLGLTTVQAWVKEAAVDTEKVSAGGRFKFIDTDLLSMGLVGAAVATFVMAIDFSMLSALENEFNQRLSQGAFAFGAAFSAMIIGRLLFQIPLGRLSDRIGRRPVILSGLLLMAPSTIVLGVVTSTLQLIGARAFQGLASAAIAAPAFAVAADLSSKGGEGRQMSLITMGFGLGIAIGPLVAGFLAVNSLALPFWIGGGLALAGAAIVFLYVPETVDRDEEEEVDGGQAASGERVGEFSPDGHAGERVQGEGDRVDQEEPTGR